MPYEAFYHPHAYFWIMLVGLFVATFILYRAKKVTAGKVTHNLLRLFYIIMIGTGVALLVLNDYPLITFLKAAIVIVMLYYMEKVLGLTKRSEAIASVKHWSILIATFTVVLLIGYKVISF
ncbi:MAG: DUF1516 family protein [Bacillaceae bacterium]|nr:DUF1516 family protein [Bacillaceae bacterium]